MAKRRTAAADSEQPSFEEAMESLETIVRRLEQGGGPLEEALDDYSTAIGLFKACTVQLQSAERRVEILSGVDAQGNPITQPLDDVESTLEEKQQSRSGRRTAASGKARADNADDLGLF